MHEGSLDNSTGLRKRASYVSLQEERVLTTEGGVGEGEENGGVSSIRTIILVVSVLGVVSFSFLASLFGAEYEFFGFHGNMEEAASSCWQTALLFAVISVIAAFPSITALLSSWKRAYSLKKKHVLPGGYRR